LVLIPALALQDIGGVSIAFSVYTTSMILDQFLEFLVDFGVAAPWTGSSLPG
jgi:hypothetical protein